MRVRSLQVSQLPFEEAGQLLSILAAQLNVTLPLLMRKGILQVRNCTRLPEG